MMLSLIKLMPKVEATSLYLLFYERPHCHIQFNNQWNVGNALSP